MDRSIAALVSVSLLFLLVADLPLTARTVFEPPQVVPVNVPPVEPGNTEVLGAIGDSIKLLVTEYAIRIAFQAKTREELDGPFWSDYQRPIRWPAQWEDSDSRAVNLMIAGDAIDRYFITRVERRVGNRVARAAIRMVFNSSRTLANLAQNHEPWRRANRSIGWK